MPVIVLGIICSKIVFLRWPISLEQFVSNTLILPRLLKPPSRCIYLIIIIRGTGGIGALGTQGAQGALGTQGTQTEGA